MKSPAARCHVVRQGWRGGRPREYSAVATTAECRVQGGIVEIVWLVVIGTSLWVLFDAHALGVTSGSLNGGFFDMSPAGWFLASLILWIVAFPVYLSKRGEYKRLKAASAEVGGSSQGAAAVTGVSGLADSITQLERLAQLKDKGIISEDEFTAKKRELLR